MGKKLKKNGKIKKIVVKKGVKDAKKVAKIEEKVGKIEKRGCQEKQNNNIYTNSILNQSLF